MLQLLRDGRIDSGWLQDLLAQVQADLEGFARIYFGPVRAGLPTEPWQAGGASPYRLLGLDPSAPDEVVKLVYRHLARRLHPDAGGSTEAMARLNGAYEEIARQRGWK